jgi:hypothetical protein
VRRQSRARDQKLEDDVHLLRAWRQWHREQLEEALAGLHGDVLAQLMAQLRDLRSARELVAFVAAQNWDAVDANTRLVALHEINRAITKLRVRNKLPPFDEGLPDEPPNAFQMIRKIIASSPHSGEAAGASGK